jgi:hypothetical protein
MKNFDHYIAVNWTGAESPVVNETISVAVCDAGSRKAPECIDRQWSRHEVCEWIKDVIINGYNEKSHILLGINCNFGYAQSVGIEQLGSFYNFRDIWQAVEKACAGEQNYFAKGFWNHPVYMDHFVQDKQDLANDDIPRRLTEIQSSNQGYDLPQSPFFIGEDNSYGKGGLCAMRMAYNLKLTCGPEIGFWPYEGQKICDEAKLVMAEVYLPFLMEQSGVEDTSQLTDLSYMNKALDKVSSDAFTDKDSLTLYQAQSVVAAARLRDLCGSEEKVPSDLQPDDTLDEITAAREGWIFGVKG